MYTSTFSTSSGVFLLACFNGPKRLFSVSLLGSANTGTGTGDVLLVPILAGLTGVRGLAAFTPALIFGGNIAVKPALILGGTWNALRQSFSQQAGQRA